MSWNLEVFDEFEKGQLKSLLNRAASYAPELGIEKAVARAIDEGCCHNQVLLEVVLYYGYTSQAFDLAYDDLFMDMCEQLSRVDDEEDE